MVLSTSAFHDVLIDTGTVSLDGFLVLPEQTRGLIVFAHGSGSSRFSRRNQMVAEYLEGHGYATLLFDLLTAEESSIDERTFELRFDIDRLSERMVKTVDWVCQEPKLEQLPIGVFGASTGAAAAIRAAVARPDKVQAVVSRGGRPDLAGKKLKALKTPTLLIVGGNDEAVIRMNEEAMKEIEAPKYLSIVPGASHLFEEPGKLEDVSRQAAEWFQSNLW